MELMGAQFFLHSIFIKIIISMTMAFPRLFFLILIQFLMFQTALSSSWRTLSGKPPVVIARGGFSGIFPDSSEDAYKLVNVTTSSDVTLWCDLQLTKDGVGICFPNLNLENGSNVGSVYPNNKERLSVDFTWKELSDVRLVQGVYSRTDTFDSVYPILRIEKVANIGTSGLWLNIQNSDFYTQRNLSMRNSVVSLSRRLKLNFISSPEISFLESIKKDVKRKVTKLIFRFLDQDQIDPFTNQSYGSHAKNLSYIRTFSSGILVPKSYIWPVGSDLYLHPHTSLVKDAHKEGLRVFASGFANDFVFAYNYSYDPTKEYMSFIDNGKFSVDGFLSDFPVTPYRAIKCFSPLDKKKAKKQVNISIVSLNGASGDFPGCTDLAYQRAVSDGVDILDCNVQMSKDKIPFCLSYIDLLNSTDVSETSFRNLSSVVSEIQQQSGIFTFSLTMSQIQTLKPAISDPWKKYFLLRNPRNGRLGKFLTLSEFLILPNRYSSLSGILIKVENAAYLAEHQGISVVDAVLDELKKATTQESQASERKILIQSTDKSVLMKFKEKKQMKHEELVYSVDENIRDVTDSAIKDIMGFAGSIVITKRSEIPYIDGLVTHKQTGVVHRLQSSGLRVYVETFSNEFVSQSYDFFADPTVEIDTFIRGINIDGIITDFPATTARYRKNQCYSKLGLFDTGGLIKFGNPWLIPPAEAPYPSLVDSDVTEPPLPEVSSPPSPASRPPASKPSHAEAKAIEASFAVIITMSEDTYNTHTYRMKPNCLFCCMSERRFTRRSSSRQSIKDCIDAKNNLARFDNISFKTDSSRRRYISEEIAKLGKGNISAHIFTFRELCVATKNFNPENQLGEGGFGRVYKGQIETTEKVVAVKQLDRNGYQGNREFLVEVMMLSLLHHQNLVNLVGYCADGDQRILVYEYMQNGSLEDHLLELARNKTKPLDWDTRMKVAAGAARGLEYLHETAEPPVIYRDFKASNILLDEEFNPKLSDFGLAKVGPTGGETHVSTRFTLMADPLLEGKYPIKGLYQALAVAAMCLQEEAGTRPMMSDVVTALEYLAMTKGEEDGEDVEGE
ncbi:unnamed protein product [Thlaspi arvense]|uniref:Glycerophosphodiester phosphodiesterase n=1 Tax=Thlaspi arvense TaxID=13288 RepID=A0AAU9RZ37_THLAR|nr:unnamed protein product [Thlaspi arvense]